MENEKQIEYARKLAESAKSRRSISKSANRQRAQGGERMSMTKDCLGITDAEKERYLDEESTETKLEICQDEWDKGDFEEEPCKHAMDNEYDNKGKKIGIERIKCHAKETPLDELIVDTRSWIAMRPDDIESANCPHCRKIRADCGSMLSINRYLSASNFIRR